MTVPIERQNYVQTRNNFSEEELFQNNLKQRDYIKYKEYMLLRSINDSMKVLASYRTLSKGMITRTVTIGTTPVRLIAAAEDRSYTVINPTAGIGITSNATHLAAGTVLSANSNTQSTPISVSNYDSLHLYINVTNIVGAPAIDIWQQTYDPISGNWIDVQIISPPGGIVAAGNYYSFFSGLGVNGQVALRWAATGAWGSVTLGIGYSLKVGLGGNSAGQAQTVYLGNNNVTRFTGYPLLEGQYRDWYMRENAEMFAVIQSGTVDINIIEYI